MNYILFNADGSIKKTNFTEVINQNSNEENQIFVSVDGLDIATHNLVGVFVLPNGEISTEAGVATSDVEYIEDVEADGYLLTLTQSETFISGLVFLTLQIKETSTNKVLYTYRVALTINESAALASVTQINLAQYNALKNYVDTNFIKISDFDFVPYIGADKDVNLGSHALKAGTISVYYNGTTYCGGFGTGSQGNLYIESNNAIILEAPHCYVGSTSTNNEIATKKDTKLYRHIVQVADYGHSDYVTLVIISKSGNAIQYLNELGDAISGFVSGFYTDEHALIYPLLECSVNLTAFGFAFIDENHEFFDATWNNAIVSNDIVEEI